MMKTRLPLLALCAALMPPAATMAQDGSQQKLERLSDEIKTRKAKQAALEADAERLKNQAATLRKRIIALATDLQNIDVERDRLEERLAELAVTENQLDADLQEDRAALSRLLAGCKPCNNSRHRPLRSTPRMP